MSPVYEAQKLIKLITKQNVDGLEIKVLLKYERKRRSEP